MIDIIKLHYIVGTITNVHYDEFAINDVLLTEEFTGREMNVDLLDGTEEDLEYLESLEDGVA